MVALLLSPNSHTLHRRLLGSNPMSTRREAPLYGTVTAHRPEVAKLCSRVPEVTNCRR